MVSVSAFQNENIIILLVVNYLYASYAKASLLTRQGARQGLASTSSSTPSAPHTILDRT